MTHFGVGVILDRQTDDLESIVSGLMAPYDENLDVPKYSTTCWCLTIDTPDPACDDCRGTGTRETTANPRGYWDYWRFMPKRPPQSLIAATSVVPYALITPDGEWHARGKMGWFAMASDEISRDAWEEKAREIFAQHENKLLVYLDVHV